MSKNEQTYPLVAPSYLFVGRKPIAVLFDKERVDVNSWREVYTVILKRCNADPRHREVLMYLRNKVSGRCRVFLSDTSDGMTRPVQIDDSLFAEGHYGAATLMHILVNHILIPIHCDCTKISIVLKP